MDQENMHLFEVKLDEAGKLYIQKIYRLAGLVVIIVSAISLTIGIIHINRLIRFANTAVSGVLPFILIRIYPVVSIGIAVLNIIMIGYYYKFIKTATDGVRDHDSQRFSQSFKYMYRNLVISVAALGLTLLLDGLILAAELQQ